MFGCSSSKKAEDAAAGEGGAEAIDQTAMNFDAAGSDSGNIAGLSTIYFDYDQANLSSEARSTLAQNAEWMKANNANVQIEGHCDSRGSIEYNLALGERRAKAVKNYMVSLGIPAARLSIISYGEEKPLDPSENESAWSKNRRANFLPLSQ